MIEVVEKKEVDGYIITTYSNGTVVQELKSDPIEPKPTEPPKPTEDEIYRAEILLNQIDILENQKAQDEVLASILLNQMEVQNV